MNKVQVSTLLNLVTDYKDGMTFLDKLKAPTTKVYVGETQDNTLTLVLPDMTGPIVAQLIINQNSKLDAIEAKIKSVLPGLVPADNETGANPLV